MLENIHRTPAAPNSNPTSSPIFPTQSDFVELAELVPYDTNPGEVEEERDVAVNSESGDRVRTQDAPAGRPSWTLMLPFSKWSRSKDQTQQPISQPPLSRGGPQEQPAPSQVGTNNNIDANSPSTRTVKSQRAWVPSSSKISLQVFWWGYRL